MGDAAQVRLVVGEDLLRGFTGAEVEEAVVEFGDLCAFEGVLAVGADVGLDGHLLVVGEAGEFLVRAQLLVEVQAQAVLRDGPQVMLRESLAEKREVEAVPAVSDERVRFRGVEEEGGEDQALLLAGVVEPLDEVPGAGGPSHAADQHDAAALRADPGRLDVQDQGALCRQHF